MLPSIRKNLKTPSFRNAGFTTLPNGFEVTLNPSNVGMGLIWTPDGGTLFATTSLAAGAPWDSKVITRQYSYANNTFALVDNPTLSSLDGAVGGYNDGGDLMDISPDGSILSTKKGIIRKVNGTYSSLDTSTAGIISRDLSWIGTSKLVSGNYVQQNIVYNGLVESPQGDIGFSSISPNFVYTAFLRYTYGTKVWLQIYAFNNGSPTLLSTTALTTQTLGSGATLRSFVWYPNDENKFLVYACGDAGQILLEVVINGTNVTITPKENSPDYSYFFPRYIKDRLVAIRVPGAHGITNAENELTQLSGFDYNPATATIGNNYTKLPLKDFANIQYPPDHGELSVAINPVDPNLVAVICSSGLGFRLYRLVNNAWTYVV